MKTFVLVLLLFSIKTNAQQLLSVPSLNTPTTSTTPTSTTPTSTLSTTSSSPTSTSATTPHTSSATSTSTTPSTSLTPNTSTTSGATVAPPVVSPVVTSVDGSLVTTVVTVEGPSSSTSSSQPTQSAAPQSDSSGGGGGLGVGSIIGLSVAGGVAVIGLIAFFIWKLTRKRFSDFDDGEAIKWPDLNTHGGVTADSHPLPVHNTGRAGFDTASENSLSRVDSNNYSTADFHSNPSDPYAVPPLPHLNPNHNQPYRDDPAALGGYDPYRGPIPGTIEQGAGESYPMTQMNPGGRMSPGPNAAYSGDGRRSPGAQAAYGRTISPGPQAAYAGRMSPGPQAAYGGSISPVPPGYDAYGTR